MQVLEREIWRIAVENLDYPEQHAWAALAGARVNPQGWRRARAMLQNDRTKELRRRFLLTCVQRNRNSQLRLKALSEIADLGDPDAFDDAIDIVGTWSRDDKRAGTKTLLQALVDKRIGRRDQAQAWVWRLASYTRELHEEYAVQRWPETKRLLGLLVNSSGRAHGRNARRLVHAARKQDRRLAVALLAAAVSHTPEGEEVLRGARMRMARKPSAIARELLRNFPKGGKRRRKRKRNDGATRAPAGKLAAERLGQVADGRGGGEGDVVGRRRRLDRLGVGLLADRLVEGDVVDLGAALAQRVGKHVAGLGGAGDEHAASLDLDLGERLDQRLGDGALGDDVGGDRRARRSAAAVPGPIAATVAPASARASRPGAAIASNSSRDAVRAGQADQRVVVDRVDRAAHLRGRRSAARSGSPAARPPRRRAPRRVAARPLAWARARVTTTRRPCSGRRSSQASDSRRADDRRRRRSAPERRSRSRSTAAASVAERRARPSAGRPSCRARSRPPARPASRPAGDQRRGVLGQPPDAHVEDERAGEARRAPPSRARSPASRGPRGR